MSPLYTPFAWARYSKKLVAKIENPKFVGYFTPEEAQARQMRFVVGREGQISDGNAVAFYWLVDETDGVIADVKFQVFGASALIGAAESACELLIRKNYDQAKRISADLIDRQVRDKGSEEAFPPETGGHLNLVLGAIEAAAEQCTGIPLAEMYEAPPILLDAEGQGGYPGWKELSKEQKLAVIEEIINREIRPYIELDAGGIQIVNFIDEKELIIAYQGSCTSCYSATGATLSAIQQILRTKVDPEIIVTPDLGSLDFS
jgi:NifU-like protein